MQNKRSLFERIPNSSIFIFICTIFLLKIIFYLLIKANVLNTSFGGGSDANYYHSYAIGNIDVAVNTWPVILRYFNNLGLYSREFFSFLLFSLNLLVIPILMTKLSNLRFKYSRKNYLYLFLLCLIYPTLFLFSVDVFRDVFMVFIFLLGCLAVKKCLNSSNILSFSFFLAISFFISNLLFGLREYLGFAFFVALFLWKIKFTKKRLVFFIIIYFLALFIANYLGFLDALTEYRSGFEEGDGGSTLGLSFSNPILFIPNFILSTLGQLFGLYITNPFAVILLILESTPFLFMLVYIVKNIRLADSFARFLIIFFVLYASVWLIGNDNLGTAVRLRLYNYLAVYICFFHILGLKKLASEKNRSL
jgi:hypothetical protein